MRSLLPLSFILLLSVASTALAQSSTSATAAATGSGKTVWELRSERAADFGARWVNFAPVYLSWLTKWERYSSKRNTHLSRCGIDVRTANRDTLLSVTLRCYRGQLLIEKENLTFERDLVAAWPGIPEAASGEHREKIDALLGAITPVIDAIDAKVFTTLAAFKDVRSNLLTQYRQPYWLSGNRLRAEALQTWVNHLLMSTQALAGDSTITPAALGKLKEAQTCYEESEQSFQSAAAAPTIDASRTALMQAYGQLALCAPVIHSAFALQSQSSSSSSSISR